MAAHGIPYVATLAARIRADAEGLQGEGGQGRRDAAASASSTSSAPCPPGWSYPTAQSTEIARLAVESRTFPLSSATTARGGSRSGRSTRCR